jgi:hypothetical protein
MATDFFDERARTGGRLAAIVSGWFPGGDRSLSAAVIPWRRGGETP